MRKWVDFSEYLSLFAAFSGGILLVGLVLEWVANHYGMGAVVLTLFALSLILSVAARMLERRGR